jgi:hypothetical protein
MVICERIQSLGIYSSDSEKLRDQHVGTIRTGREYEMIGSCDVSQNTFRFSLTYITGLGHIMKQCGSGA